MDHDGFLRRIEDRAAQLGLSIQAVSMAATDSRDTIRNWQRRHRKGEAFSMRQASIDSVARVLGVSAQWLMTGDDSSQSVASHGFAEESSPYRAPPSEASAIAILFSRTAKRPEILRRQVSPLPWLGLMTGDLIICDLGRDCQEGDLVLVHYEDDTRNGSTLIRRWLPPWLVSGDPNSDATPLRDDQPEVTIRYPVVGSIRGA